MSQIKYPWWLDLWFHFGLTLIGYGLWSVWRPLAWIYAGGVIAILTLLKAWAMQQEAKP